jgi:uncharacterized protein (TIGR01244 family)
MQRPLFVALLFALLSACQSAPPADPQRFHALGIVYSFTPTPDVFCSGQPTPDQFAQLQAVGVQRVVCLRSAQEDGSGWEEAKAAELGLEFVRVPVEGATGLTVDNAAAMARHLDGAAGAVLVTCGTSNRVGALFALKARFLDDQSPEEALAIGRSCGLSKAEPLIARMVRQ